MNGLLTRFNMDTLLTEEDPELRITGFLTRVDEEIYASASCGDDRRKAGRTYLLGLANAERGIEENVVDFSALKSVPPSATQPKGDTDTDTTVSDSLNSGASSSFCSANAMSSHVNGTHYVGNVSPSVSSVSVEAAINDEMSESENCSLPAEETMKERNRRLLMQHRELKVRAQNYKEIDAHKELPTIKEDDLSEYDDDARGDVLVDTSTQTEHDASTEDFVRRDVLLFLERKFRSSCRVKNEVRKRRSEPTMNRSPANILRFGYWSEGVLSVACVTLLYSSPAARYAMFRSLRRFKPGD